MQGMVSQVWLQQSNLVSTALLHSHGTLDSTLGCERAEWQYQCCALI